MTGYYRIQQFIQHTLDSIICKIIYFICKLNNPFVALPNYCGRTPNVIYHIFTRYCMTSQAWYEQGRCNICVLCLSSSNTIETWIFQNIGCSVQMYFGTGPIIIYMILINYFSLMNLRTYSLQYHIRAIFGQITDRI